MSLLQAKTRWVLFLASSKQAEHRHILDLAYGLMCLEKAGVSPANIAVYIDGPDRANIGQWLSNGSRNQYEIKPSVDFFADQKKNTHENLVMFVTGHGSIDGIESNPFIKPNDLVAALKGSPALKHAVVYLGQCDAGIFNYVPIGRRGTDQGPDLIFVGATNLHSSISSATQEEFVSGLLSWSANLFLLYVFKWIQTPVDVDGDGRMTIMDSYKFAGAQSNAFNKWVKSQNFVRCMHLHEEFVAAKTAAQAAPNDQTLQLALQGANKTYAGALDFHFTHQECWILNSWPAQELQI